MLRNRYLL